MCGTKINYLLRGAESFMRSYLFCS